MGYLRAKATLIRSCVRIDRSPAEERGSVRVFSTTHSLARATRLLERSSLSTLLVIVPGLVALATCVYQLTLPNALWGVHGSDDGVYLAPALRLIHGAVPYRDYAFVHPPGIAWLMTPLAIFGDTRYAMAAARIVTAIVAGLNASLAAYAVRSCGRVAMLTAGLALAVFPLAVSADHTLTLDPYLVLFCLLGTIAMFSGGRLATPPRIMLAGALFGFAGAVKLWAVFPVIAALCVCVPLWTVAVRPFLSGLLLGFGAPTLPFFLLAPQSFVHDIFIAQLHRHTTGQGFHSVGERLVLILGLGHSSGVPAKVHLAQIVALAFFAIVVAAYFVTQRKCSRLEAFVLAATAIIVATMLFVLKEFYEFYSYFVVAFGVMVLGVCFGRLAESIRWAGERIGGATGRGLSLTSSLALPTLVVAAAALIAPSGIGYARPFLSGAFDPRSTITSQIPRGACVLFDEAGPLLDSDRFHASMRGCPPLVDAFGLWLTDDDGVAPPARPVSQAFVDKWTSWLERADYAVLGVPQSDYVPWTPDLVAWFNGNYRLVASEPRAYVYEHVGAR